MPSPSMWLRWIAGCRNAPGQSHRATGDEFHQGNSGGYTEPFPCPNGLPIDRRAPDQVPAWRKRIEKAKLWSAMCQASAERDELAENLTDDDVHNALERLIKWEQSQQQRITRSSTHS